MLETGRIMKRERLTEINMAKRCLGIFIGIGVLIFVIGSINALAEESNMQLMDADALAAKYMKYLESRASWSTKEMEVQNIRINPRKIWLPQGNVSFKIDQSAGGALLGKVSSMVTILVDGEPLRRARVCASIEVYKQVLCASRGLRRGQIITPDDLTKATMPLSKLKTRYFQRPEELIGLAANHTLRPGQIITADHLTKPAVVKRGSRVIIVAESPAILVRVPGQVEEKGAVGDFVRVKNLGSRRVIIAQVMNSNTVKVNF